ncbi:MAG: phosphodiester glycosidase family protein [Synergistaceae bacterium]|jgi:exopolysaccharide biosynthesis protein|nr:phosphodiester glycosidase family protein [Synergistaceae bacterium]
MKNNKIFSRLNALKFRRGSLSSLFVVIILFCSVKEGAAVTRAELLSDLFNELGYSISSNVDLPPDISPGYQYAKPIGSAVRYGLIPKDYFMPDETVSRHDAVRMSLMMMGWGFEASLYESLGMLPDLAGSGDSVFFLAAEMKPQAPPALLIDGATPLSESGKKSLLSWVRSCKSSVMWNRVLSYGGTDLIIYRQGVARPGVSITPRSGNPVGASGNDPLYVAAIAMYPSDIDQRITFAGRLGAERTPLSDFVSAYDAVGAVNGGFFAGGRPMGSMLLDGVHAGKPLSGRSAIGWNNENGTFVFGPGYANIGVRMPGGYVVFDNYNVAPQMNQAAFYNSGVMSAAMGAALDALELIITNGVVTERREGSAGNHFLPEGSSMIVARGNSRALLEHLRPGDKIEISTSWETGVFQNCTNLIQAGPILVRDSKLVPDNETFKSDIIDKRHPRTIVGTDGKRIIWAVADGRSTIHSFGATLDEARWIAKSLGMSNAINMDGGGSSELIWRGVIVNSPSDGKERPLPYAVLMMPKGAALTRKNLPVEYGEFGYSTGDDNDAVYMDTYNPLSVIPGKVFTTIQETL